MGRVHPRVGSGRVGLARVGSRFFPYFVGWVGSGPIVWVCQGRPGLYKNVTLSVIVKFTQFRELLVLLKLFSV